MEKKPHTSYSIFSISYKLKATSYSRGFTLFYAVLVTSLLLSLGLAVFNITIKELVLSSDARESQSAFYAADTALECALFWDLEYTGAPSPAFGYYGDSLASGLVAYWRMDEGEGSSVFDTGSGSNDGERLGIGAYDGPEWIAGHTNDALSFEGSGSEGDYIGLEQTTDFSGEFTITAWVQTSIPAQQFILAGTEDRIGFVPGNQIRVTIDSSATTVAAATALSSWAHLVIRREGDNTVEVIINDSEVLDFGTKSGSLEFDYIGKNTGTSGWYNGDIDDLRVYNRALTDEEVTAMYQGDPHNIFVDPLPQGDEESGSNVFCGGQDVSIPETGWDEENGWDTVTSTDAATTTFDLLLSGGRCAFVTVSKNVSSTTIVARGYNTCEENDNRRLERALRAEY